jgi:hypothetical protein
VGAAGASGGGPGGSAAAGGPAASGNAGAGMGPLSGAAGTTAGGAGNVGGAGAAGALGGAAGNGSAGSGGNAGSGGSAAVGGAAATEKFSFFVTSWAGLQRLAKGFGLPNDGVDGFGGDLRYGETGAGAGLRGADKICATLAEASMTGAGAKGWRAFLSASDDGTGQPVNAIDRIGTGPCTTA